MFLQDSRKMAEKLSTFGLQMALNKDVVGPNLRNARERKHWTKPRAAMAIGISERQLSRWEKGEVLPRWNNLITAADAYGVDPADLTQDGEAPADDSPTLGDLMVALAERQVALESKLDQILAILGTGDAVLNALSRREPTEEEPPAGRQGPGVRPPSRQSGTKRSA